MEMSKILLIFTGGTIDSSLSANCIGTDNQSGKLLQKYQETEFICKRPYTILSENLDIKHLNILIDTVYNAILQCQNEDIAGIIITHGTDSLCYSAAMLQYLFGGFLIPIMLVSSNYVLSDERANGQINFDCAVDFIINKRGNGVYVSYSNDNEVTYIHRGNRIINTAIFDDKLFSLDDKYFGRYEKGTYHNNQKYIINPDNTYLNVDFSSFKLANPGSVLRIIPYPGAVYPAELSGVKAVLLNSYHSGTIRVGDELRDFMSKANKLGILVYLCGADLSGSVYETVNAYKELGIIPLQKSPDIAQFCKLFISVSLSGNFYDIMKGIIAEEN